MSTSANALAATGSPYERGIAQGRAYRVNALRGTAAAVEGWVSFGPPSQSGYQTFTLKHEHQP